MNPDKIFLALPFIFLALFMAVPVYYLQFPMSNIGVIDSVRVILPATGEGPYITAISEVIVNHEKFTVAGDNIAPGDTLVGRNAFYTIKRRK